MRPTHQTGRLLPAFQFLLKYASITLAEGSEEINENGGSRVYLEWHDPNNTTKEHFPLRAGMIKWDAEAGMKIFYIHHSGFLVETQESYYLFDYVQGSLPPLDMNKPLVALCSHGHADHYRAENFAALRQLGMKRVSAVLAKDIRPGRYPEATEVLRASANQSYVLPGGERLETLLSTDSGVAYLLTTAEGAVYHAGDLNEWTWAGETEADNRRMRGNYRHEIDKLSGREIEAAFVVLDPRQGADYAQGMLYFLKTVGAKRVYPMHYWGDDGVIRRFKTEYPQYSGVICDTENEHGGE